MICHNVTNPVHHIAPQPNVPVLEHFKTVSRAGYRNIMDSFPKSKVIMACTDIEGMVKSPSGVVLLRAKKVGEEWSIDCLPGLLIVDRIAQ